MDNLGHEKSNRRDKAKKDPYRSVWVKPDSSALLNEIRLTPSLTLRRVGTWTPSAILDQRLYHKACSQIGRYKKRTPYFNNKKSSEIPVGDAAAILVRHCVHYFLAMAKQQRRFHKDKCDQSSEPEFVMALQELNSAKRRLGRHLPLREIFSSNQIPKDFDPSTLPDPEKEKAKAALDVLETFFFLRGAIDKLVAFFEQVRQHRSHRK